MSDKYEELLWGNLYASHAREAHFITVENYCPSCAAGYETKHNEERPLIHHETCLYIKKSEALRWKAEAVPA